MDTLKKLYDIGISFFNNSNFLQILAIITAMGSSYWTAKYNASRPHRLQVKQLQLEHVYIPLHHVFMDLPETLNKKQALYVHKKMNSILSKYYELAFPQLHSLNQELGAVILANENYNEKVRTISHQISIDYELLKKDLGYPSENILSIFIRMTRKQQCLAIISHVNVFMCTSPMWICIAMIVRVPNHIIDTLISILILAILPVVLINYKILKMKD